MTFSNSLFQAVFSWYSALCSSLWHWISGDPGTGLTQLIADHWLKIVIVIILASVIIDFLIYLLRWRPYKVWASFFRRLTHPAPAELFPEAVSREAPAEEPYTDEPAQPVPDVRAPAAVDPAPRAAAAGQPVYGMPMPSETLAPAPSERPARTPASGESAYARPRRSRRARSGGNGDTGAIARLHYVPPATPGDASDAYNEPYVPPQWHDPGNAGASSNVRHRRTAR